MIYILGKEGGILKAIQTSMLQFMQQQNQVFIIPVYQRTYKWTRLHCKQLLQDILRVSGASNTKTHFIGSVVYITDEHYQATKVKHLTIIDGQQRLTTLSLLLMAMCNYLEQNSDKFTTTYTELFNQYLVNQFQNKYENEYIKLQLTKHDKEFYQKLIRKETIANDNHNIYNNYKFFYEQINSGKIDIDDLYDGIGKLMIVDVSLIRTQDDPQLIFESLNSTGAKLTQADLIRNYLLMDLNAQFQDRIYNEYWFKIEKRLNEEKQELSDFIRDYLTLMNERIPNKSQVYEEFKKFFNSKYDRTEESLEALVKELMLYSTYYEKIIRQIDKNNQINRYLIDFYQLDVKVIYPLIMKLYYDYENNLLSLKDFTYILQLLESFVIRRLICGAPTNSLSKVILSLIKELDKSDYVGSIERILVSKKTVQRFPRNDEFKNEFLIKDIYNLQKKNRRFILDKLENYENKEILNIDEFTIEHIMPQTTKLSDKWVKALGDNWKEIHSKYLHTIGNLTLTRYNSEMSSKFFTEKRDMEGGFRDSACRLNKDLRDLSTWNEDEIINRANRLFSIAEKIWPYPTTAIVDENYDTILDFDDDWTGKKPTYFTFMDEKYPVKDITQLYVKAISLMYEYDPEMFTEIINDEDMLSRKFWSTDANDFNNSYLLLDTNININTNLNSENKKRNLLLLLNKIGFTEHDFIIYL